jgi:mannose-6-phosphate isomerase-like protein (cupin superfamily)
MNNIHPGNLLTKDFSQFRYMEKSIPESTGLSFLTYGIYELEKDVLSGFISHSTEETLLFNQEGDVEIEIENKTITLEYYDVLYIPRGATYRLRNTSGKFARIISCRAIAENIHPLYHASWKKVSSDDKRIRILEKKKVYLMFDVSEKADKLIAGYTIYEPYARAYPPHNHTDQEEIYIFSKGNGAMEVYPDEKDKTFVTSVDELDAVTIPVLNYHPVFSQSEELHFIWCIAGERYWVGDKNKDFMDASVDKLTT